jgi:hypothetical protein
VSSHPEAGRLAESVFTDEDLRRIDQRIAELERKTQASAVGAPMRAAFEEEIEYRRGLRGRIAPRVPPT